MSNEVPRSAFSAAIELLTYIVADPSSERYTSSSYSYCRKMPPPPQAALQMTSAIAHARRTRITGNDIVKISPA
jgi:hypothetical protein